MGLNEEVLTFTQNSLMLVLLLPMPVIGVAVLIGLLVGLFQALTQINDQTFSFAFKLVGVIVVLVITASKASSELLNLMTDIFDFIPQM